MRAQLLTSPVAHVLAQPSPAARRLMLLCTRSLLVLALCAAWLLCAVHNAGAAPAISARIQKGFASCAIDMETSRFGTLRCLRTDTLRETYNKAREDMDALREHKVRSCWRQPWEELRDTFLSIAISMPSGNIAAQSVFRAGECQEALARCSHLGEDYRMALGLYEAVYRAFPKSVRADDALLACATIAARNLNDRHGALDYLGLIEKSYAAGDAAGPARELKSSLAGKGTVQAASSKSRQPVLNNLTWQPAGASSVEVRLDFTRRTDARTSLVRKKNADLIVMDLGDTEVVSEIRRGLRVSNSLLRSVQVQQNRKTTKLVLSFARVGTYKIRTSQDALVLTVQNTSAKAAKAAKGRGLPYGSARTAAIAMNDSAVRVVTIDAGHGGIDPGTLHNGVIERKITLDVALRLGRLLTDNGFRVIYTRKSNRTISLARRTEIANENRSDLFVSIHVNAHHKQGINGVEIYYLDTGSSSVAVATRENGSRNRVAVRKVGLTRRILESRKLARDMQQNLVSRVRRNGYAVRSKGVKTGPFFVLATAEMPSVLAEIGYCTNEREAALLKTVAYRQAIAEGLAEGIMAYRDRSLGRLTAEGRTSRRTTIQ